MLEIGVEGYHSIKLWLDYFPNAFIYGVDIKFASEGERFKIICADQSNLAALTTLVTQVPQMPFIIDDGSHVPAHQLLTFDVLFQSVLTPGGIYIIEDVETSYWRHGSVYGYPTSFGLGHPESCVEIFKSVVDYINAEFIFDKSTLPDLAISKETLSWIESIQFNQNCIIITKKTEETKLKYGYRSYRFLVSAGNVITIVTNCNRRAAQAILAAFGLAKYVSFIVTGSECSRPKPHPDPYERAIELHGTVASRVVVFEDHMTGLQSARSVHPSCIVGVRTAYDEKTLLAHGAHVTIADYCGAALEGLTLGIAPWAETLIEDIKRSAPWDIVSVKLDPSNMKGGFISDVLGAVIETTVGSFACVLKLENSSPTFLTEMARTLGLCEREYYFYENLADTVNVRVPAFYCIIRNCDNIPIGILLENMFHSTAFDYKLNIELGRHNLHIAFGVINNLAKLHAKYSGVALEATFPGLKRHDDSRYLPGWQTFMEDRWEQFSSTWAPLLSASQLKHARSIISNFSEVQRKLSSGHLTLIHGDMKSPNLFYAVDHMFEPCFLDWQHVSIGKGVQDLLFFLIESFDFADIDIVLPIFKNYYYIQLCQRGVTDYTYDAYCLDFSYAIQHVPLFVCLWFGTVPADQLIDKNFPFFFIQKTFACLKYV